jgi:uncharacterized phiE125 gp8 family phage protein
MTVSLALAKQHLRVDHDDENALITAYLAAATAWVENYTGKKLTRGVVSQEESEFGCYINLIWGPAPETVTIEYTDTDDTAQEITDALLVKSRLFPAESWPDFADNTVIAVNYTAGYSVTPADLDYAVMLLVGDYYKNRETDIAGPSASPAVENLCRAYRILNI